MKARDLLPRVGDRETQAAWEELFSRDMLGSVFIGTASGKAVEWLVTIVILLTLGPDANPLWEAVGFLLAWGVGIWVGIWVFVHWHEVSEQVEGGKEKAKEKAEEVKEKAEETKEAVEDAASDE